MKHMHLRKIILMTLAVAALGVATARAQDNGDPLYVAGYIDTTYAARDQVAALLRQFAGAAHKQPDLIRFEVLQRTSPNNQFMIMEIWKDQQARDIQMASALISMFGHILVTRKPRKSWRALP